MLNAMGKDESIHSGESMLDIGPLKWLAIILVTVILAAMLIAFFTVTVCNQQITGAGKTVEVCRHLEVTDPPITLGGLILLIALGAFFTEVSGFGISLKRDVQGAKEVAESASEASRAAKMAAELAEETGRQAKMAASSAEETARLAQSLSLKPSPAESTDEEDQHRIEEVRMLAEEYNAVRQSTRAGPERTAKMTEIVYQMIALLSFVGARRFHTSDYLSVDNRGLRLAGYAFLYANPDPRRTQEIAAAVLEEDKPFGQYWGLRTLRRQVQIDPMSLDLNTRRRLMVELAPQFGPKTDRSYELQELLRETDPAKSLNT